MTRQLLWIVTFAFGLAAAGASRADDASPWVDDTHSAIRLLAGSRSGGVLLGGIVIRVDAGWKTYWRYAGDSGVPPRFDFARSENVESVTVLWPAPTAFADGAGGQSLGYRGETVLPLKIVAKAADRPIVLRAHIDYAVCEKICVPVSADAELAFTSVASSHDGALFAALDSVPKPAEINGAGALGVRDIRRDGDKRVVVEVTAPQVDAAQLFVEGPTPDWALPIPKRRPTSKTTAQFVFDLDGLPPGVSGANAKLRLTLVGGSEAIEVNGSLP